MLDKMDQVSKVFSHLQVCSLEQVVVVAFGEKVMIPSASIEVDWYVIYKVCLTHSTLIAW